MKESKNFPTFFSSWRTQTVPVGMNSCTSDILTSHRWISVCVRASIRTRVALWMQTLTSELKNGPTDCTIMDRIVCLYGADLISFLKPHPLNTRRQIAQSANSRAYWCILFCTSKVCIAEQMIITVKVEKRVLSCQFKGLDWLRPSPASVPRRDGPYLSSNFISLCPFFLPFKKKTLE